MAADAAKIAQHIRERLAKSGMESPAVNITREGWDLIVLLLEGYSAGPGRAEMLLAAIEYTLEEVNDLDWLRSWVEGDEEAMQELVKHLADEAEADGSPQGRVQ